MSDSSWPPRPPGRPYDSAGGPQSDPRIGAGYRYERPALAPWPTTPAADPSAYQRTSAATSADSGRTELAASPAQHHGYGESIGRYAAPKRPNALIILLIAALVVAVGAFLLTRVMRPEVEAPTPSVAPTATASPTRTGGVALDTGTVTGYWLITNQHWDSRFVTVTVQITVDEGLLYYSFYAFGNDEAEVLEPVTRGSTSLVSGYVSAGQPLSGTITFETPRQELTLVMSDGVAAQYSALPIHG